MQGFFQSKLFTILLLAGVFFLSISLVRVRPQKIAVEKHLESLEDKIKEIERSNSSLAKLMAYFKSPAYLEREAKLKLNVRRPDENVVFIFQDEKEVVVKEEKNISLPDLEGLTNFEKWMRYLFK
ncbi:MAG: septum formation initiator family protein [Candidatus Yanofskybacteria bacterium]|nr:septum formation initiator family protein [Candidatus Yanofskybacteria bacterium]